MTIQERSAEPRLMVEWALCGIAAAASRFVPIPFIDDAAKEHAIRLAVVRTLRAHGRGYPSAYVEPLYSGSQRRYAGLVKAVAALPRAVGLYSVRKYVALFGAVRGVPNDVLDVILLARTVDHCLARGWLTGDDREALSAEAAQIRQAFDAAIKGMDLRLLRGVLADGLSQGRGLTKAAVALAAHSFGREQADPAAGADIEVQNSAERVAQTLRRPEVQLQLAEFDGRVQAQLDAVHRR